MPHYTAIVGTRPNFIKLAPLYHVLTGHSETKLSVIHTGQHYDDNLSGLFFRELDLPTPSVQLTICSGDRLSQIEDLRQKLRSELTLLEPDLVIVFGDVNSTLAGAKASHDLGIPIAHVEAGLRSFDPSMPEESNRIETDRISDFHFITESAAFDNLLAERICEDNIHFVGNVMIDNLTNFTKSDDSEDYMLWTIHRPSNVDQRDDLMGVLSLLEESLRSYDVVWPMHPRTRKTLKSFGLWPILDQHVRLHIMEPLGHTEFTDLLANARIIVTDSGGIQEEACYFGVPCLTLRNNTERPVTIQVGANRLIMDNDLDLFRKELKRIQEEPTSWDLPELWDGQTSQRIVRILQEQIKLAH